MVIPDSATSLCFVDRLQERNEISGSRKSDVVRLAHYLLYDKFVYNLGRYYHCIYSNFEVK